jgi:hypothetical protein
VKIGKIMDSKIIYLGYAQWADRGGWVAVLSESGSTPPSLKNGSGEDADPPSSRRAAFLLDAMVALPRKSDPGGAASLP